MSISIQWGEVILFRGLAAYYCSKQSMNEKETQLSQKIWEDANLDVNVKIHAVVTNEHDTLEFNRTAPVIFTHDMEGEKVYFSFRTSSFRIVMQDPVPTDPGKMPLNNSAPTGNGDTVSSDYYFDKIGYLSYFHSEQSAVYWQDSFMKSHYNHEILDPPPNFS
jgi:hypothetical protein